MITQPATSSRSFPWRLFLLSVAVMGMALHGLSAEAASPQVPWECSNYTDAAQTRCLNAFIERQQEQIAQLEGRVQAQQDLVGQLKGQVDRQTPATGQLQQQLSQPPVATAIMPPPGIGLYLGRPWGVPGYYGYYGRPYWGPRFFYRHYGRRW